MLLTQASNILRHVKHVEPGACSNNYSYSWYSKPILSQHYSTDYSS